MVSACGLAANKEGAWVLQNTIIPVMSPTRAMQASITWASGARTAIRPYSYQAAGRWRRPLAAAPAHTGRRVPVAGRRSRTLCRRALGQALGAGLLRTVAVDGDYQEIRFELDAEPWAAPCRRRGPDELPTAVVEKPWDSHCACVNSDVITRAWRRRSISVRSGARSLFTTPCDNRSRRAARLFSHAMIPPRCSVCSVPVPP